MDDDTTVGDVSAVSVRESFLEKIEIENSADGVASIKQGWVRERRW